MPIALATTEVSVTASTWPVYEGLEPLAVDGDADELAVGDAALATSGPMMAAPPAPPTMSALSATARALRFMTRRGGSDAGDPSVGGGSWLRVVDSLSFIGVCLNAVGGWADLMSPSSAARLAVPLRCGRCS